MWTLLKRYQDCVTDTGDAFIGYWARMTVGALTIPYAALLAKHAADPVLSRVSFRRVPAPASSGNELHWDWPRARLRASWAMTSVPSFRRVLYDGPEGDIRWDCRLPCASARVAVEDRRLSGLGYAEQLVTTVRPWDFPIRELRWGRFLSADDAVTWIDWCGPVPRRWVFHNGVEMEHAIMREGRIDFTGHRTVLVFGNRSVLRRGPLMQTALRPLSRAGRLLPRALRNTHETKWLARGTLTGPTRTSSGWVIHEVVRWA